MKIKLLSLLSVLAACAHAPAGRTTQSLAEAERAFAADAQTRTVNEAFLSVLTPDAILFRPGPRNAHELLKERPYPPAMMLRWTPVLAETSSDGSMGFTTGPADAGTRGAPPTWTGWFVSVWQRERGDWKLVLDAGIAAPIPTSVDSAARLLETRGSNNRFSDDGTMRAAEQSLVKDYAYGLRAIGAPDLRLYRDGGPPTTTLVDAIALVGDAPPLMWQPTKMVVAPSGDLGYVYGVQNPSAERPRGYLRIYRRRNDGTWQLVVDLA